MRVLIIGGTGFFGKSILDSFVCGRLKKFQISELIVLSRSTERFQINYPEFVLSNIKYINGDIAKVNSLPEADIVIHAATSSNQKDYIIDSFSEKQNTELGVSNYIKLAGKFHKNSKIVYCSSGAVYGKQPENIKNIKEDFPFLDVNSLNEVKRDYALSKRNAESQIKEFGASGYNVSIARCFAFYGKYLPEDGHFAYASFLKSAKSGKDIIVNADHEVIRSYLHADDLVNSLIKIALYSNETCPIFNVGSDIPISIFELAEKIAKKYSVKVIKKSNIKIDIVDRYVPNIDKLKELSYE
jgi:nucleoside-diphosphate-sugar epimerase